MRIISIANFIVLTLLLFVSAFFYFSGNEEDCPVFVPKVTPLELPKSPFADSDEFFQDIGDGPFSLKWVAPKMQLPDLRQELLFLGKNARPDSLQGKAGFHFSLKGSQEKALVWEGERTYLLYQGNYSQKSFSQSPPLEQLSKEPHPLWGDTSQHIEHVKNLYYFSPDNQPTPLWFEVRELGDEQVEIHISMMDEKGALVASTEALHAFKLKQQDSSRPQNIGWELGGNRVDATLLVRQKARFVGRDLFLELHGGEEFIHAIGKERIDFLDASEPYSCFVDTNTFLIWKDERWQVAEPGEATHAYPLMCVKKIDEKLISFELWDPEGRGKTLLSLVRCRDHGSIPNLSTEFKFVGAKTWAQFIVESRAGERMTLKPEDWLVLTQDGWIKLSSADQIDAFVDQTLTGPLFILEKMVKKNGRQVLVGHIFNASRTEMEEVELASSTTTPLANFYRHLPITPPIQSNTMEIEGDEE